MHFDNDHMPEDNHNAGPAQTATLTPPPVSMEIPRPNAFRWRWLRELLEMAFTIIAIYTLVNLLSMRYIVHGRSMDPTFGEGQFLIVSRAHYWFEEPERGDVVVFHAPSKLDEDYIKRVIGVPGDHIESRDQQLYLNGALLDEPYLAEACSLFSCRDEVWAEVPPGSYFVLGDNRNSSVDSRRVSVGFVDKELLVGKVLFRYWPLEKLGMIDRDLLPTP